MDRRLLAVGGAAAAAALSYAAYVAYLKRCEALEKLRTAYTSADVVDIVKKAYAETAKGEESCCVTPVTDAAALEAMGYSAEDRALGQQLGADLGLGCGNPVGLAELSEGEVVVDLGSGAGFDCILAARAIGASGMAIGVDMVPEMIEKAYAAIKKAGVPNAEFKLGHIDAIPVDDSTADCIISNCVLNLAPDQAKVCREMFRTLKPGGRVAISDVVRMGELPEALKNAQALACWVSGAPRPADLAAHLEDAGFEQVVVAPKPASAEFIKGWLPGSGAEQHVVSANVTAVKPVPKVSSWRPKYLVPKVEQAKTCAPSAGKKGWN